MNFPKELRYTKDHEWARVEGGVAVVGITDFAQTKLGSIVFVDLPAPGKTVKKGDTLAAIDSVKAVADVFAPLTGEVDSVNESLRERPEVINEDPYGDGWMVKLRIADAGEVTGLMAADAYETFVAEEEAKE